MTVTHAIFSLMECSCQCTIAYSRWPSGGHNNCAPTDCQNIEYRPVHSLRTYRFHYTSRLIFCNVCGLCARMTELTDLCKHRPYPFRSSLVPFRCSRRAWVLDGGVVSASNERLIWSRGNTSFECQKRECVCVCVCVCAVSYTHLTLPTRRCV